MIPLTYEENKKKFAIYPKENSMLIKMMKIHLNYITKKNTIVIILENYTGAAHNIFNQRYKTPK